MLNIFNRYLQRIGNTLNVIPTFVATNKNTKFPKPQHKHQQQQHTLYTTCPLSQFYLQMLFIQIINSCVFKLPCSSEYQSSIFLHRHLIQPTFPLFNQKHLLKNCLQSPVYNINSVDKIKLTVYIPNLPPPLTDETYPIQFWVVMLMFASIFQQF